VLEVLANRQVWVYPHARAIPAGSGWSVNAGKPLAAPVLPHDVPAGPQLDVNPGSATWTLGESVDSLTLLATMDDPRDQAEHLASHLRHFGDPEPCLHGLPMPHARRGSGGNSCKAWSEVAQVVRWATYLDAVDQGLRAVWRRGEPSRPVARALFDLLDKDMQKVARGEDARDGHPSVARVRQVVELAGTRLLRDGGAAPSLVWQVGSGPGLALTIDSVAGLAAFHVVNGGGRDVERPRHRCAACERVAIRKRPPRDGEDSYCGRTECIKERKRRNKARERAAAKGSDNG
jgi:hypothetical protein